MKKTIIGIIVIIIAALALLVFFPLEGSGTLAWVRQELRLPSTEQINSLVPPQTQTISYQGVEGKNALELLKQHYSVQSKDFGPGLGEFVESIDGATPQQDEFWGFFVNGESSNVGASSYITKDGELIEWKIEKVSSAN